MLNDVRLDHIAVAAESIAELLPRYAADLGGAWVGQGGTAGFMSAQVEFAGGMKVEMLEPYMVEHNDFLRRFLDRNGPGPHHLTYKLPDLAAALPVVEAAGYQPVGVNLESPSWKEAFLHPKAAPGVVVQLAEAAGEWRAPPPADLPAPRSDQATLTRVVHAVRDVHEGLRLFRDLLGGQVTGEDRDAGWVELSWPPAGAVRIVEARAPDLAAWVGDRPGRIHHVAFAAIDPGAVAGAEPGDDGSFEVAPEQNHGTRLVLRAR